MSLFFLTLFISLSIIACWNVPKVMRSNIAKLLIGINVLNALPINADDASVSIYTNDRYHTKFLYPKKYIAQEGLIGGDRAVEAFVDPDISTTSVSIVYTPIPGDFTRISSFGSGKETIRDYLVPKGNDIESEVLNENLNGDTYTVEYIVKLPEQEKKHVTSIFALRPAETVVGLTIQCLEENYNKNKDDLKTISQSFTIKLEN